MKNDVSENISIYVNLLKTIMGCGILKYPILFKEYGIIPTIFLTLVSSLASYAGIFLYIDINDKYGLNNTLSTVTYHFKPFLKYIADIVVIFKCYTVGVAYLIYLKDQINSLNKSFSINISENISLAIILVMISPFVFMNKLDKLKYTSTLGLLAVMLLISTSFYRFRSLEHKIDVSWDTGNREYIKKLGHFVFSFTCHQNIFTVQNEMKHYNKTYLKISSLMSFISAVLVYIVFGILSYMAFGDNLRDSFIDSQPEDNVKTAITVFYVFLIGLSLPLQTNPCKQYTLNMIKKDLMEKSEYAYVRAGASLIMIVSMYFFSISGIDFDKLCGFIGGTFSTFMCFIFASLYHFLSYKVTEKKFNTFLAFISFLYGTLSFTAIFINK